MRVIGAALGLLWVSACGGKSQRPPDDVQPPSDATNVGGSAGRPTPSSGGGGAFNAGASNGGAHEAGAFDGPAGGAPVGGAPVGGAPVTGSGGRAGGAPPTGGTAPTPPAAGSANVPSIPPPSEVRVPVPARVVPSLADCTLYDHSDGFSDACNFYWDCHGSSRITFCTAGTESGPGWTCSCDGGAFEVLGVEGTAACELMSKVCFDGDWEYAGPETCELDRRDQDIDSCETLERCVRPAAADSATASVVTRRSSGCLTDGDRGLLCLCESAAYYLSEADPSTACDLTLELCKNPPAVPEHLPEPECAVTSQTPRNDRTTCQVSALCEWLPEVGPNVSRSLQVLSYAACESDGQGGSRCACSNDREAKRFDTSWEFAGDQTCERALRACDEAAGLELTGEVVCGQRYLATDGDFCDTALDCTREASFDGDEVIARGDVDANCSRTDGDAWVCWCGSGTATVKMATDAATAWDACTIAGQLCPEVMEVQFDGVDGSVSAAPNSL